MKRSLLLVFLSILAISSSHAFGLPPKKTERVDGRPSTAVISGGASNDGGLTTTDEVSVRFPVEINVSIVPEAEHIKKHVEIVVVVNIGDSMLVLDHLGNLSPLNEMRIPSFKNITLGQNNRVQLFRGSFADSDIGEYGIFVGYRLWSALLARTVGDIIYTVEPISLRVQAPPAGLTLYKSWGEYVPIPYKCELPSCVKTKNAGYGGPDPVPTHGRYRLAARPGNFTISSIEAVDLNGATFAFVQGLEVGQIIPDGEEVAFTLVSGLTGGKTALLQWTIEVEGLGIIFIDTLSFKSN